MSSATAEAVPRQAVDRRRLGGRLPGRAERGHPGRTPRRAATGSSWLRSTRPPGDGSEPNAAGNHRKNLALSLETGLRRLRTGHIDLYWVHLWDRHTPVEETVRALDGAVRAGKVTTRHGLKLWRWPRAFRPARTTPARKGYAPRRAGPRRSDRAHRCGVDADGLLVDAVHGGATRTGDDPDL
ncbi:aldo/keto reductase [Actinacidiphila yeochonensis]|uniref:aldo/keto reductase n=1 Tax=Actinacidiphila yeochonensis TaxID=89050 RepID=UPI00389922E6